VVRQKVVGGHQRGAPAILGRQDDQPGVPGLGRPGFDLTFAVGGPDVGVQDKRDPVYVVGKLGEHSGYKEGIEPEKGVFTPCRGDGDQLLSWAQMKGPAIVQSPGSAGEHPVVAGITREECSRDGFGAPFGEPIKLLHMRQRDRRRNQPFPVHQRVRGESERPRVPASPRPRVPASPRPRVPASPRPRVPDLIVSVSMRNAQNR
jgi:hypothetical protein